MNAPQINIRGDFAVGQHPVEMLRAGFADGQIAQAVEILVFDGDFPAPPGFVGFLSDDVFHHVLPGARGQLGISAVEIHPCQRQIEMRLAFRFVVRLENALRLKLVAGLEAGLLAGDFVFEVKDTSGTTDETECLFH